MSVKTSIRGSKLNELGYVIEPSLTFTKLVQSIHEGTFQLESLAQSFRDIEQANEKF